MTQKSKLKLYNLALYYHFVSPNVSIESLTPSAFRLISLKHSDRVAPVVKMSSTTRT